MADINRLGLGCMGMNMSNKKRSIETVHYALDQGITLLNTGEFYGGGESEMVLREALAGVPRDSYFLSVKFGVLPNPQAGIYGLDVSPFNVKAHLAYSMHRLGVDFIDLYEPARMDEAVPVEELVGAIGELVDEGYIGSIGMTQASAEDLKRAASVRPIALLEYDYSLVNRQIENNGVLDVAREHDMPVLAFGVLAHGMLSENVQGTQAAHARQVPPYRDALVSTLGELAREKHTSAEAIAQAFVYAKHPDMRVLIGTTSKEHLQESIDALKVELTAQELRLIDEACAQAIKTPPLMRNIAFRNGRMIV